MQEIVSLICYAVKCFDKTGDKHVCEEKNKHSDEKYEF